ncbi:UvrD-helicase domain-containing protein [Enterococcus hirae]|uniref:UvrD-helicase domain-containing protein n=1 Tax=Enterococcus hirae TaxID=1354 RepID=UPI000BBC2182|nr:UvrD-helicase domain-containing protein [Enterococcus hirae]PCE02635.1 DNA helicase UvrD [Enterococcus hirae]
MVEKSLEVEVESALHCIENKENFILTGGAGSGKTYSLISLIEQIGLIYPQKSMACITYTNNAVGEIRSRITNDKLWVSTIHEFIWNMICRFQKEIKETLVELINDSSDERKMFKKPREFGETDEIDVNYFKRNKIIYDEYYNLNPDKESKISHDHILVLAERMFKKYRKLSDILKDSFNYIFVDEYQDTSPLIKEILLTHVRNNSKKDFVVGFFGDSMQAIYDTGVGSIEDESVRRISKVQNRRNPQTVITLANKLRIDEIEQVPSNDISAPNMKSGRVIEGTTKFVFGETLDTLEKMRHDTFFSNWDFTDGKTVKELWLTHKFNAEKAGFQNLYELYNSDLIFELITKINRRVNNGNIDPDSKTFEVIASEAQIKKRRNELLLEVIRMHKVYSNLYSSLASRSWEQVAEIYINKDSLLSYKYNGLTGQFEAGSKRDIILRKLDIVYELLELYHAKKYNSFLRTAKISIEKHDQKILLNKKMNELSESANRTIGDVILTADDFLPIRDEIFNNFINGKGHYQWNRIKNLPFKEYTNSIMYQKEFLPFATQHSVKGSEYDNVLVVLDNGKWNKYDFRTLFNAGSTNESVKQRSAKLFYVCCTRAKRNLVVFMPTQNSDIISKAIELFGEDNVFNGDKLI